MKIFEEKFANVYDAWKAEKGGKETYKYTLKILEYFYDFAIFCNTEMVSKLKRRDNAEIVALSNIRLTNSLFFDREEVLITGTISPHGNWIEIAFSTKTYSENLKTGETIEKEQRYAVLWIYKIGTREEHYHVFLRPEAVKLKKNPFYTLITDFLILKKGLSPEELPPATIKVITLQKNGTKK